MGPLGSLGAPVSCSVGLFWLQFGAAQTFESLRFIIIQLLSGQHHISGAELTVAAIASFVFCCCCWLLLLFAPELLFLLLLLLLEESFVGKG